MFEDIIESKIETITAVLSINCRNHNVEAYDIEMSAGTVTGLIKDKTLLIDDYTRYGISIPLSGKNYSWAYIVLVERVNSNVLKFYTPWS